MNFTRKNIEHTKKSSKITYFIGCIFITMMILCFWVFNSYSQFQNSEIIKETREIKIKSGDSLSNLGKKIKELDTIFYKIYIKNNKPEFKLGKGVYKLKKGDSILKIFESLQKPIVETQNITILEGWNIFDIDTCLSSPKAFHGFDDNGKEYGCLYDIKNGKKVFILTPLINPGEYINYVQNPKKIKALSKYFPFLKNDKLENLEGFLYPDTYKIKTKEFAVKILVIAQLEQFEKRVYKKLFQGKYNNATIYDVVNLASIVEKEEKITANKSTVAGILKKRLNAGWMIGADATVCYPHKLTSQKCKMVVSKYIREKSEYNTRTMKGLPKTPIANPTFETINATLNDKKTPYWYYLHNVKTGKIYYAKDNAGHEYNKANFMNK